jgi:flagellar motor protein MotB
VQDKRRLPRIERHDDVTLHEDENQHLWAVSYSDFLMALLSFFILFFSVDTPERAKLVMQIASQFHNTGGISASSTSGVEGLGGTHQRVPASLIQTFQQLHLKTEQDNEALVVDFPNNLFLPGEHIMASEQKNLVEAFLQKLKPYSQQINIYFEGHTDNAPLRRHKNAIVVDNYVLSSLRANSALSMARSLGFSEKNLFIQANSSNIRNSRSLSIRIEPKTTETL